MKILAKDRHGRHYDFEWVLFKTKDPESLDADTAKLQFEDPLYDKTWVIAQYEIKGDLFEGCCFRYDKALLQNHTRDEELIKRILAANALCLNGLEEIK